MAFVKQLGGFKLGDYVHIEGVAGVCRIESLSDVGHDAGLKEMVTGLEHTWVQLHRLKKLHKDDDEQPSAFQVGDIVTAEDYESTFIIEELKNEFAFLRFTNSPENIGWVAFERLTKVEKPSPPPALPKPNVLGNFEPVSYEQRAFKRLETSGPHNPLDHPPFRPIEQERPKYAFDNIEGRHDKPTLPNPRHCPFEVDQVVTVSGELGEHLVDAISSNGQALHLLAFKGDVNNLGWRHAERCHLVGGILPERDPVLVGGAGLYTNKKQKWPKHEQDPIGDIERFTAPFRSPTFEQRSYALLSLIDSLIDQWQETCETAKYSEARGFLWSEIQQYLVEYEALLGLRTIKKRK